jgi:hypothetical protein
LCTDRESQMFNFLVFLYLAYMIFPFFKFFKKHEEDVMFINNSQGCDKLLGVV